MTATGDATSPAADIALARQLERAEAMANAAHVEARREVRPAVGAAWIEVAGAYAMFDGVSSPLTQTFGVGVFEQFGAPEFERVEAFFFDRGAPTSHEICSFATPEIWTLLSVRGYTPIESSVVMVRSTAGSPPNASGPLTARRIDDGESALWARLAAEGWSSEAPDLGTFLEEFGAMTTRARGVHCFVAELNGHPIATAALNVQNGIGLLAGASTIPAARRQGAQRALFEARLRFAAALGIDLAMVVAQPGSASQRNAERQGFRPVYVRSKWQRAHP